MNAQRSTRWDFIREPFWSSPWRRLLIWVQANAQEATKPPGAEPAGKVVFRERFDRDAPTGWDLTDRFAWRMALPSPGGTGPWNCSGPASTSRRFGRPSTSPWPGRGRGRLHAGREGPIDDARLRPPRPLPLLRISGPEPLLLRPPGQGGRPACQQHLPRERPASRLDRRVAHFRHPLDRRLAQGPARPGQHVRPDSGLLRRYGPARHDRPRPNLRQGENRRRLVRRHWHVR